MNKLFFLLPLVMIAGCTQTETSEHKEAQTLKAAYYCTPEFTSHHRQSPINILTNHIDKGVDHHMEWNLNDDIRTIENLGHTVELLFENGSSVHADGKDYETLQLHFHTPSEHLIDGLTYPMEMHIVNSIKKDGKHAEFLVVGVLFKMGETNAFINEFIDAIPAKEQSSNNVEQGMVKIADLFGGEEEMNACLKSAYHYPGSLTTAPYTENVNWYVLSNIFEASPEQIEKINKIEKNNARHIQAIYDRKIDAR
ncbi:carbonic anhydrase family protein [Flammeovirgaceae bacterium SG7u.111]|nr:carbonic anhydrase family protein [Flammeovirgaceae bacterium SG7u.132]WPO33934.1 carbonic anhydrase family protein [Flammeovirgaceae bacterium SG7u.111]